MHAYSKVKSNVLETEPLSPRIQVKNIPGFSSFSSLIIQVVAQDASPVTHQLKPVGSWVLFHHPPHCLEIPLKCPPKLKGYPLDHQNVMIGFYGFDTLHQKAAYSVLHVSCSVKHVSIVLFTIPQLEECYWYLPWCIEPSFNISNPQAV